MTIELIRKVLQCWEPVKLMVVGTSFPKFHLSLEGLNFILGNKRCQLSSLYSVLRKYLPNTQMWITLVWAGVLWSINGISWKMQLVQFASQGLFVDNFRMQQKCFMPVYVIHKILRCVCKDQDLIKLMTFYCLIKNILNDTGFLKKVHGDKECSSCCWFGATPLIGIEAPAILRD